VAWADQATPVAREVREGLEDQATRAVREGREDQVARVGLEDRVVPGDPEGGRVDPAGTNDPAVSAGGLLPRRECKSRPLVNGNHSFRISRI
jgi:hypothetical protein